MSRPRLRTVNGKIVGAYLVVGCLVPTWSKPGPDDKIGGAPCAVPTVPKVGYFGPLSLLAKATAVATVFLYTGLPRVFLLNPKTQIMI